MQRLKSLVITLLVAGALAAGTAHARGAKAHYFGPTGLSGNLAGLTIKVTTAEKGSPADGKVKPGAIIVGVGGETFKKNVRLEMAEAINVAETEAAGGKLVLGLKGGKTVDLQLKVLGSYSDTAPYNCPKTDAIIQQAAEYLAKNKRSARLKMDLLGLLATGEQKYIDLVRAQVHASTWATPDRKPMEELLKGGRDMGYVTWSWGYTLILLGEYYLLTEDEHVLPGIEAYGVTLAKGQDGGGLFGHRLISTKRNGRLPGYAQMNQPSLTCFMGMLLAKKCGIKDPDLEKGIEKSGAYFSSFVGRGAFNYGVHGPNNRSWNNNGTSGSAALDLLFLGNKKGASFFSQLSATSYGGLETGHTGHFFNVMWTPLGANVSGPEVSALFAKKSRWLQTLYRAWNGRFTFNGGEYKGGSSTGSHLLAHCVGRRKLLITGRDADESIWLKGQTAVDAVNLSQINYADKTTDELQKLVQHPIPQVRRRAGWVIKDRKELEPRIAGLLENGTKFEKQMAMGYVGYPKPPETGLPYLERIVAILKDTKEDAWVRASAASSLAYMGEPARKYYMDVVRVIVEDRPWDRFGDIDWSLSASVVKLCPEAFKAGLVTDKELFYKAALKLANNKRQHVRGQAMRMLVGMPKEDFHRVADTVVHVVKDTDPTYHSYHSPGGPVANGIRVLAAMGVREGLEYARGIPAVPSGKGSFKLRAMMDALGCYGGNAKQILEELKKDPRYKDLGKNRKLARNWNNMVKAIEGDKDPKPLISLEEAKRAGTK